MEASGLLVTRLENKHQTRNNFTYNESTINTSLVVFTKSFKTKF